MVLKTGIDLRKLEYLYTKEGLSSRECAKLLGFSKSAVAKQLKDLGLSREKNGLTDSYGRFVKKGQVLPPPDQKGPKNPGWKGGISSVYYRRIAFELLPNLCVFCGSTERLDVHHKDKNRKNNDINNLSLVCALCHQTIEHNKPRDEKGRFLPQ